MSNRLFHLKFVHHWPAQTLNKVKLVLKSDNQQQQQQQQKQQTNKQSEIQKLGGTNEHLRIKAMSKIRVKIVLEILTKLPELK